MMVSKEGRAGVPHSSFTKCPVKLTHGFLVKYRKRILLFGSVHFFLVLGMNTGPPPC